ncbi:MAG: hypothetical protein ACFFCS_14335 [Candidatus Hodarchaeota archaeon]
MAMENTPPSFAVCPSCKKKLRIEEYGKKSLVSPDILEINLNALSIRKYKDEWFVDEENFEKFYDILLCRHCNVILGASKNIFDR